MAILGIDVSKWQGVVDYDAVAKTGVKFAIAKAVHGKYQDGRFATNWVSIKGKLVRGAYAWYIPEQDAIEQADAFLNALAGFDQNDIAPAIDFEQPTQIPAQQLLDGVTAFVRRVREQTGRKPLLYTGTWYWRQYVGDLDSPELVATTDLWHAEYPNLGRTGVQYEEALRALGTPHPPTPWAKRGLAPKLWQFDGDKGLTLPNGQDADFNRFDGTDEEFSAWVQGSVSTGTVCPALVPPAFTTLREVQVGLLSLGYDLGVSGADGVTGPKTEAAIRAFQTASGLTADGVIGPKTRAALVDAWTKHNATC